MWHVCGRSEIYTRFCWRTLKKEVHFGDLREDGVLKWTLKNRIDLIQGKEKWRALVNTAMCFRVS